MLEQVPPPPADGWMLGLMGDGLDSIHPDRYREVLAEVDKAIQLPVAAEVASGIAQSGLVAVRTHESQSLYGKYYQRWTLRDS